VGTDHRITLVGVLPEQDFAYRVELEGEGAARCVATGTGTNGPLPSGLPEWAADVPAPDQVSAGFHVLPALTTTGQVATWLVIVDEQARAVWAWNSAEEGGAYGVTRVQVARDGSGLLFGSNAVEENGPSWIGRVSWDGGLSTVAEVAGMHTDFVEISDGRLAYLGWEIREVDGEKLLGDTVVITDGSDAGEVIWRSFDNIPIDPDEELEDGFYVPDPEVYDWSHVNGIDVDEANGSLLVTMTAWDGLAAVDLETGEQEWFLADGEGDFDRGDDISLTALPHSVQALGDGRILVFNRGLSLADPDSCSEAVEIFLDEEAGTATREGSWSGESCLLVSFLGQARRLGNGNTVVDWSSAGRLDEFAPDGTLLWSLAMDVGAVIGFTVHFDPASG